MKLSIFSVRDQATDQFGTPMFMLSQGQAIRSFTDEVNRAEANNQLFSHASDFALFSLGSFDTDSGVFDSVRPVQVVTGSQVFLPK